MKGYTTRTRASERAEMAWRSSSSDALNMRLPSMSFAMNTDKRSPGSIKLQSYSTFIGINGETCIFLLGRNRMAAPDPVCCATGNT